MQVTLVQSLAWEDPTCHGATKPVYHDGAHVPRASLHHKRSPSNEKSTHRDSLRLPEPGKSQCSNEDLAQPKIIK